MLRARRSSTHVVGSRPDGVDAREARTAAIVTWYSASDRHLGGAGGTAAAGWQRNDRHGTGSGPTTVIRQQQRATDPLRGRPAIGAKRSVPPRRHAAPSLGQPPASPGLLIRRSADPPHRARGTARAPTHGRHALAYRGKLRLRPAVGRPFVRWVFAAGIWGASSGSGHGETGTGSDQPHTAASRSRSAHSGTPREPREGRTP